MLESFKLKNSLFSSDAKLLSKALISLKFRNPFLLKTMSKNHLDSLIKGVMIKIKNQIDNEEITPAGETTKEDLIKYLAYFESSSYENNDLNRQLFLTSMIHRHHNSSDLFVKIIDDLMRYKWEILMTDQYSTFITSDNPGYCVDHVGFIHNMHFSSYIFYFPLTPFLCLRVCDGSENIDWNYFNNPIIKEVKYVQISSYIVSQINVNTSRYVNKYVLASSRQALNTFFLNRNNNIFKFKN